MPSPRSLVLSSAMLAASPVFAGNLVANGDVESPSIAIGTFTSYTAGQDLGGWTVEGGGVDLVRSPFWVAAGGQQSLDLNGTAPGGVRQALATVAGQDYEFTYAHAGNFACGATTKSFTPSWAGVPLASVSFDDSTASATDMQWRHVELAVMRATTASTELAFQALAPSGGCGPTLDKVEVVPRVTPYRDVRLVSRSRVAFASGNGEAVLDTDGPATADGRYVAFAGDATDLAANDGDDEYDVFVADLATGIITAVSRTPHGGTPNGSSYTPTFTPDGRWLLFASEATNLATVGPNPPAFQSYYLQDRQSGAIRLVSVDASGTGGSFVHTGGMQISDDGRYVPMPSPATNLVAAPVVTGNRLQLYLRDVVAGTTTLVTRNLAGTDGGNGQLGQDRISRDGRYVVFASMATDLVAASDGNNGHDVFVHDRIAGTTVLASHTPLGAAGASPSQIADLTAEGTRILFESSAADLVAGDTNGVVDVFVYETATASVSRVSCAAACTNAGNAPSADSLISDDGRTVVFTSSASDLVAGDGDGALDLFARDLESGAVELLTPGANGPSSINLRALSADGELVLFSSDSELTADDANAATRDLYLRDRTTDRTVLVSRGRHGSTRDVDEAFFAGRRILMQSAAKNMTGALDANDAADVYVVELADLERAFRDGFE